MFIFSHVPAADDLMFLQEAHILSLDHRAFEPDSFRGFRSQSVRQDRAVGIAR